MTIPTDTVPTMPIPTDTAVPAPLWAWRALQAVMPAIGLWGSVYATRSPATPSRWRLAATDGANALLLDLDLTVDPPVEGAVYVVPADVVQDQVRAKGLLPPPTATLDAPEVKRTSIERPSIELALRAAMLERTARKGDTVAFAYAPHSIVQWAKVTSALPVSKSRKSSLVERWTILSAPDGGGTMVHMTLLDGDKTHHAIYATMYVEDYDYCTLAEWAVSPPDEG